MNELTLEGKRESQATEIKPTPPEPQEKKDFLQLIKDVLTAPCVNLLRYYLGASNDSKRKTPSICLSDFRRKHPFCFRVSFFIDFACTIFYISIVVVVGIRGLGIIEYLKSLFS